MKNLKTKYWVGVPPWILVGSVVILVPIFVFWTMRNINEQKESTTMLLLEKGAALIRSFEAGTRTGMMGMMGMMGMGRMHGMGRRQGGGEFRLQNLLTETAQQPDIVYLIVTDINGKIIAHNDPERIGEFHGTDLDLKSIAASDTAEWRQVKGPHGADVFEVFRRFSPTHIRYRSPHGQVTSSPWQPPQADTEAFGVRSGEIIFVGLDMGPMEEARKEDARHTLFMAAILLLIWFAGIFSLFLVQAYRSTRTSLSRIKAFSDTVVENMPIGLMAIDAENKIVSCNQTAESVLQIRATETLGKRAEDVLPEALWNMVEDMGPQEGIVEGDLDCRLRDGRTVPLDASVSMLEGEDNVFLGHIILFRDMTEMQALKKEIERSERLASLGRLAAGVAHEIRNPLSSIKGFATYFRERYQDVPEDRKTAEIMVNEVERLNRVIGQLLEFARPMNVQKRPTSMRTLVQHSLKMIERRAHERGVNIESQISPEVNEIALDPDRFSQVLLNLHLNAIEAMEEGGRLRVDVSEAKGSNAIEITISDTGHGIDRKDLDRVFDPYFTTKQSGTGLGLAIVHKIIESHGGEVKVESEEGKGTRVTILLPR